VLIDLQSRMQLSSMPFTTSGSASGDLVGCRLSRHSPPFSAELSSWRGTAHLGSSSVKLVWEVVVNQWKELLEQNVFEWVAAENLLGYSRCDRCSD